ncbi:hypothetical protein QN277_022182 [Acacia crassicarpa]|uniref:NADP-dependent oxidoreductase domain-containing protein n=1 Tax=Acacia crassicarpa TaxID=499986 RepID=A0AAE1JEF1_9FABA|nr:hypothetical protein QN277_022182 [Acacia crassicarpa]
MARVSRIKLGSQGLEVSAQGLGCMGMSAFYGAPQPKPDMIALIHHAVQSGVTLLDTSDIYGPHTHEILLGKVRSIRNSLSFCLSQVTGSKGSQVPFYSFSPLFFSPFPSFPLSSASSTVAQPSNSKAGSIGANIRSEVASQLISGLRC